MKELSGLGVLPSLAVLMLLVVPYSLQTNIVQPCWECYDFEVSKYSRTYSSPMSCLFS